MAREHGTNTKYVNEGCRCESCMVAHATANREWLRKQPKNIRHFGDTSYGRLCKECGKLKWYKDKYEFNRKRFCSAECGYKGRVVTQTFEKGHISYKGMLGKNHSPATIEKMKKVNRGKAKRGEESPLWRGGSGTQRHQEMRRFEYKYWRDAVFKRDNYTCQICDQYSGHLHADHIKSWAEYQELRYDVSNGRTLCRACHYYITFKRKMPSTSRWGLTSLEK